MSSIHGSYKGEATFRRLDSRPESQLARSIARYGLFSFLDSNQSNSDLLYLIEAQLPSDVQNMAVSLMNRNTKPAKKSRWKTRALGVASALVPILAPVLQSVDDVLQSPGTVLLATLKSLGSDSILTDPGWGTTTVKTQSYGGDLAWSTKVSIGTPPQDFRLNIDSGSADLFLFAANCKTCSLSNHTAYQSHQSTTKSFFTQAANFFQTFGDGSTVGGRLAADLVAFGNSVQIAHQTFGLASNVSSDWAASPVDGLMGIGPDILSVFPKDHAKGVFPQLIASGTLASPVIGVALVKERMQKAGSPAGEFTFGGVSGKWIAGGSKALSWKNVTSHSFWGVSLTGIYVEGLNVMAASDPPRAIIDTGTSLTLVSRVTAAAIHKKIPGSVVDPKNGIWKLPCSIHNDNNVMRSSAPGNVVADALNYAHTSLTAGHSSTWGFGGWSFMKRAASSSIISSSSPRDSKDSQLRTRSTKGSTTSSPNIFFEFGVGTSKFAIPAEDLAYQSSTPVGSSSGANEMCYSGIQAGGGEFAVLGDTFIKNQYIAFRYDSDSQKSVGLGLRKDLPVFH